ncbi:hypothetical protein Tco_1305201 [Tanacetum coccineum]
MAADNLISKRARSESKPEHCHHHLTIEPSPTPPHPKSFMHIMSMIQRGERPPNIQITRVMLKYDISVKA